MLSRIDGATVYYEIHGSGARTMLLLHGWGGRCESWSPVLRDFGADFRMIALDFPGHARSSEPPEAWSVTEYMELTAKLMRFLHIEGADVIAHSFGGRVAILLAATYPELVGKLVLTDSAGLIAPKSAKHTWKSRAYRLLRAFADSPATRKIIGEPRAEKLRCRLQERFGSADYKALTPSMRKTFSRVVTQDLAPYLPAIRAKTLLFWGESDAETPLWMGEAMRDAIPDAEWIAVEGAGHYAYLDAYARFAQALRDFLITE